MEERGQRLGRVAGDYAALARPERRETVIVTGTNADRREINERVRLNLKARGELEGDREYRTSQGAREFAPGDRVIFLKNDRELGVKNGQVATVRVVGEERMTVQAGRRLLTVDLGRYDHLDHGYALTVHKAQGITADRALVHLDTRQGGVNSRNAFYVDISRARHAVTLYTDDGARVADVKMWVKMGVLALLVCLVIQVTLVALVARSAYREQFTFQVRPGLTKALPFSVLWKYYLPSFVLFGRESRVTPHAEVRGFFPGKTTVPVSEYRQGLDRYLGRRIAAFEATFVSVFRWSFFNEIRSDADFDVYAKIVFTPPKEAVADPFWLNAAKDVFVAGLRFLHLSGKRANADIWDFFCQDLPDITHQLQALPLHHRMALKHIDTQNKGPGASVISVLTEKISFFRYLSGLDGTFSFRDFITSSRGRNLFLLNIKNYASIFRPLMTFAFDVMIRETLSLPDTDRKENRRIWFCIDEIGSLDQISVLFDLLTVARSKGGCLLVANQDLGRIEDIYGRANRRTFYNNFNTNFILRLNDPDTADFLSQSIGEREVIKVMGSRQMSPRESGDRKSFTDQDKTEKLILPSEFINQPDFHCVVKVSGHGISEGVIPRTFYDPVAPHFLDRYAGQPLEEAILPEGSRDTIGERGETAPAGPMTENPSLPEHTEKNGVIEF
ncbi:MAG: type IV secretion system DNA-binding domain-containing protein [Acidobacteria bacterium]|nr:type IV secretion system DNA-binding domain-containing protein [Acidobacteriota bacterium]